MKQFVHEQSPTQPVGRNQRVERVAVEEFEREERHAVQLFDGVNGDDVGVIEGGGRAGLALESLAATGSLESVGDRILSATRRWSLESSAR